MIAALALAAAVPLAWEGTAKVYDGATVIPLTVRSRMEADGTVVSDSWPTAVGRAKGLHRLVLRPDGSGSLTIGTKSQAAPAALIREERAQFGFYQEMQAAARNCARIGLVGVDDIQVDYRSSTHFRCDKARLTSATNLVAAAGKPVRQDFRMTGWWSDGDAVFPKRLIIKRDGKPFFDLTVTHFRSR